MSFDSQISNYYEKLVVETLAEREDTRDLPEDRLIDIACVALNQLPARYYRYSVDMAFYLSATEHDRMTKDVETAIEHAVSFVETHKSRG